MKLAIFSSHPIQYKSPLYRRLAGKAEIDLEVFYYSRAGLEQRSDPYHGMIHAWDIPLLEGYPNRFLLNLIPERSALASLLGRSIGPYFNPGVVRTVVNGGFDAVILHSYQYPSDWLAWMAARVQRTPILFYGEMYPRGPLRLVQQVARHLFHRLMIRSAEACLAIGSIARDVYLQEYGIPIDKIFIAPYTVDNDFFTAESARWRPKKEHLKAALGIPHALPVVLCVAAMVPKKHQEDLIEAMARLRVPAQLVLVGDGPHLDQMRAACQALLPQTILTGFVNQSELPRFYALADIFVLPSQWEEFGLVVNEAMCAALPIIVSDNVGAGRDLVIVGENGFTYPFGDIDALTARLNVLLKDRELRQEFGSHSLRIISNWNIESTVSGILAALEYVC